MTPEMFNSLGLLPVITVLISILINICFFAAMNVRINRIEQRQDQMVADMNKRLTKIEIKLGIQP